MALMCTAMVSQQVKQSRRTSSNAAAKKPTASRTTSTSSIQKPIEESDDESSESDVEELVRLPVPKRKRTGVVEDVARMKIVESQSADGEVMDLQDRKGRWRKHYGFVREKMGNLAPNMYLVLLTVSASRTQYLPYLAVHAEGQTKIHHILRVFDLSYEYGPCIGVTRLERWERAEALGLKPPPEVREILFTKQGQEEDQFRETVFYGEA
ncbi:hypothetical protein NEOLEDRAFT_1169499 [Neolentinus lepideus HHB14362 ss-1]|uniref:DNA polymerase delta subunit 4 n=1 Tax=Neolentinus lepideus HHB14362 ss-1 TaxID=1314782 RepID=A0A165SKV2_9AGAM|nr:hypothetical protein NEOLEDRAFT_1169499 [Neolentinus lepideus HHB14362 ss-1]